MKKIYISIIVLLLSINSKANINCYIKIGFGDCINCYNVLSAVKDFNITYIFKSEFKGLEKDILKEYLGIDNSKVNYITSDSFYNSFGYGNFTALKFNVNEKEILNIPMSKIDEFIPKILELKNNKEYNFKIKDDRNVIDLTGNWHSKCQIKIIENNEIVILDPLLNKISKLDEKGTKLNSLSINPKLISEIYDSKFGDNNDKLEKYYSYTKALNINSVPVNFNKIFNFNNYTFVLYTAHYFIVNNLDTTYTSFIGTLKIDKDFKYKIHNIESVIDENYFVSNNFFYYENDSNILLDVICPNTENKPYIIANLKLINNVYKFTHFLNDEIPQDLVNKNLNYRVTNFSYDKGYYAFQMFNSVYFENKKLNGIYFFDNYVFGSEFPNPKNLIVDIKLNNSNLYISYMIDSIYYVTKYSTKNSTLSKPIFSISTKNIETWLQLDKEGYIYYLTNEKKLIKIKI